MEIFGIKNGGIEENEDQLYDCVKNFLIAQNFGESEAHETQDSSYAALDVYVVGEDGKKVGVEVKHYFTIFGAQGEAAFGQALLRKKREDVKQMFVAFPMSERPQDSEKLIGADRIERIKKTLELLGERVEIENVSLKELNKRIYDKAYSSLGIGLLGIMGTVNENGKFELLEEDPVKELYPPSV